MMGRGGERGFSLVELLVAVSIVAVVMGVLAPSIVAVRSTARAAGCAANLRACWAPMYRFSEEHGGLGPAIGQPYGQLPHWPLVVLEGTSRGLGSGESASGLYREESVLVCASEAGKRDGGMTRTYGMNGAGHNRAVWNEDVNSYDAALGAGERHVGIRFDLVKRPSDAMVLVDTVAAPEGAGLPARTQTYGVLDLRTGAGQGGRVAWRHGGGSSNALMVDGSVASWRVAPQGASEPLP